MAGLIITICILLLLAYVFDITAASTKIPSVILLLLLGWVVRQITIFFGIPIPNLTPALPILGTIGLVLIVLEGSLELEIDKAKHTLIWKSIVVAVLPIILFSFGLAYVFEYCGHADLKIGLVNAIPFAVISSAVAIPTARHMRQHNREFVVYESSLSDIFGVIFFNFIALNRVIDMVSFENFFLELLLIIVVSFASTIALSYLLGKIKHHVKFMPIILLVILIYSVSKIYHLPALIFILLFGLFLNNLDKLKEKKWIEKLRPMELHSIVHKFREQTTEVTFLIRALFFLLFGYLIQTRELLNPQTFVWAAGIVGTIFVIRVVFLLIFKLPIFPLVFIAPRGLISILLFLSIAADQTIALVNNSLMIQVIVLSSLVMMFGMMQTKRHPKTASHG